VDWKALAALLGHLDARWASLGWALSLLLIAGLALRWQLFLRQQGIQLPFTTVFSLTWAGQFFNSILPGATGGDVVKIYQLCRLVPDRKAAAAATVFVDRLSALLALLVLAGSAFVIDPVPLRILSAYSFSIGTLAWLLILLLIVALAVSILFRTIRSTLWGGRLRRTLAAAKNHLSSNRKVLAAVLLAFALHLLNFLIAYLFAKALGISVTYLQTAIIVAVVMLLIMLPVTINGHGLRELLLIAYFTQMGITIGRFGGSGVREIAVAFSLVLVANDLLWSIPGGIWYMARFKGPIRDDN
jgi:glycosyltransferase 2 family protein